MLDAQRVRFAVHARLTAFRRRVERSEQIVADALGRCRNPYIALSGGKDSTVVADLLWRQRPKTKAVYFDADCAYPEVTEFLALLQQQGCEIVRFGCRPFLEILKMHGLLSDGIEQATMRYTVYEPLQELYRRFNFDAVFLGLRAEESPGRRKMLAHYRTVFVRKSDGVLECNPIAHWSFADVWAYLVSRNLPYCAAYDKLFAMELPEEDCRISYWAGETKRRWGRYEALRRGWPELWQRLCDVIPEARQFGG